MSKILLSNLIKDYVRESTTHSLYEKGFPSTLDGLGAGRRRLIFTAYKLGLFTQNKQEKFAKLVTDCMSGYHPVGDEPIYKSAVKMARPYLHEISVFRGEGNLGARVDPSFASMRYPEVSVTDFGREYVIPPTDDLDLGWRTNHLDDENMMEPSFLPVVLPYALIHGDKAIAFGHTAQIPKFNILDLINCVYDIQEGASYVDAFTKNIQAPSALNGGEVYCSTNFGLTPKGTVHLYPKIEYIPESKTVVVSEFEAMDVDAVANEIKEYLGGMGDLYHEVTFPEDEAKFCVKVKSEKDVVIRVVRAVVSKQTKPFSAVNLLWKDGRDDKLLHLNVPDLLKLWYTNLTKIVDEDEIYKRLGNIQRLVRDSIDTEIRKSVLVSDKYNTTLSTIALKVIPLTLYYTTGRELKLSESDTNWRPSSARDDVIAKERVLSSDSIDILTRDLTIVHRKVSGLITKAKDSVYIGDIDESYVALVISSRKPVIILKNDDKFIISRGKRLPKGRKGFEFYKIVYPQNIHDKVLYAVTDKGQYSISTSDREDFHTELTGSRIFIEHMHKLGKLLIHTRNDSRMKSFPPFALLSNKKEAGTLPVNQVTSIEVTV